MTSSTLITDYTGRGTHANRPTTPNIPTGATAVYYETDTTNTFVWSGSAWVSVTGGGGSMSFVSTVTASASASLSFTGISPFKIYKLVGILLIPATSTANLLLTFGTGAGPTYASAGYFWTTTLHGNAGDIIVNSDSDSSMRIGPSQATTIGNTFDMTIYHDGTTQASMTYMSSMKSSDTHVYRLSGQGGVALGAALTAVKIAFSAGNITSGTLSLYTVAN